MACAATRPPSDSRRAALEAIVARCGGGELPPNVALMHLIAEAAHREDVDALLAPGERPGADESVLRLAALWRETPGAWDLVRSVLADAAASSEGETPAIADLFDRLAVKTPDAASALYALGRSDVLDAGTASIVDAMERWGLVRSDTDVLDVGCGSGRITRALATRVRSVAGVDVSIAMLERARAACAGHENVRFHMAAGTDLGAFPDGSFDLVTAVDVVPYVEMLGPAATERLLSETARVLKGGGSLLAFNWSYRKPLEDQRRDVGDAAARVGFVVIRSGTRDVDWWDGRTFHLRRYGQAE
jgi:SAM-dependent methyltransferase